jgi:hypothetical protein
LSKASKLETIPESKRDNSIGYKRRSHFNEDEVSHSQIIVEQRSRNYEQMSYTDTEDDAIPVPIRRNNKASFVSA